MAAALNLRTIEFRLAHYYLEKMHTAAHAFNIGHEHATFALALFDQEWSQIKQWQAWAAMHTGEHDELAYLCKEYGQVDTELFSLRQHPQERLEWLETGLAAARLLGDLQAELVHCHLLGRTYTYLGILDTATEFAERALALAQQLNNPLYMGKVLITFGNIFYSQDEYERSRRANEQALALGKEQGALSEIAPALNGLGNAEFSLSNYERAHEHYLNFLEISEANGQSKNVCLALRNLGMVTKKLGDALAAAHYMERAATLARAIGAQPYLAESLAQLGNLASAQGNLSTAYDYLQQSLELSRQISHHANEVFVLHRLGYLLCQIGNIPSSLECHEAAFLLSKKIGERWFSAISLLYMAEVYRVMKEIHLAYLKLHEGLQIARAFESKAIRVKYLLEAALLWHDDGEVEQAAIWVGLLQANAVEFSPEQVNLYNHLCLSIKNTLSQEHFDAATQHGKSLDLDSEVELVFAALS